MVLIEFTCLPALPDPPPLPLWPMLAPYCYQVQSRWRVRVPSCPVAYAGPVLLSSSITVAGTCATILTLLSCQVIGDHIDIVRTRSARRSSTVLLSTPKTNQSYAATRCLHSLAQGNGVAQVHHVQRPRQAARARVCVCVCVYVRARACVCVCVCVCAGSDPCRTACAAK